MGQHGKPILDMIEFLGGKEVPGRFRRISNKKREQSSQLMSQYKGLLTYLKSRGGLLHEIRPEQLLNCDEYVKIKLAEENQSGKLTSAQILNTRQFLERHFSTSSINAWATVAYQALKIFLLNRVTPKQLKSLPG